MNLPAASYWASINSPSLDGRGQGRVKYQTASPVTQLILAILFQ
jgi:hypothetical protein